MKRALIVAFLAFFAVSMFFAVKIATEDYKAGKGFFMSTETYRDIVREGKR